MIDLAQSACRWLGDHAGKCLARHRANGRCQPGGGVIDRLLRGGFKVQWALLLTVLAAVAGVLAVSYTHLDVYKRQALHLRFPPFA